MNKKNVNRRKFLQTLGLTAGTGLITSSFSNQITNPASEECKSTPILELGPYATMKYRKQKDHDVDLTKIEGHPGSATGQIITVFGRVTDKNCHPIKTAVVEIWSANHYGKYHHEYDIKEKEDPNFQGWGQAITNENGEYKFKTILPGLYAARTRHIHFKISKRDYHELTTQLFFEGEERNKTDFILSQFTHEEQQLITRPVSGKENAKQVEFNITLEKIQKGSLPGKVLKEYTGKYTLKSATFDIETYIKNVTNNDFKNIELELTHKKNQLFMTLPFSPTIEMGWAAKDEFQSWSFYNTFVRFKRDDNGKVTGLRLHFSEEEFVDGIKKNNR